MALYTPHNGLQDLTANMMSEVCKDTEIEPKQTPLSGEELQGRTSNNSNEVRVDIRTRGFWDNRHFSTCRFSTLTPVVIVTSSCSCAMLRMNRK